MKRKEKNIFPNNKKNGICQKKFITILLYVFFISDQFRKITFVSLYVADYHDDQKIEDKKKKK